MKRRQKPSSYNSYGTGSVNIRCGFRFAKFSIVSANTPFAQANQLPKATNVSQMPWEAPDRGQTYVCTRFENSR